MSTGALSMGYLYKRKPRVSMLVIRTEGEYFKKATDKTTFTCEDGALIRQAIEGAFRSGEPVTVIATSVGKNEAGELVAQFRITWSFKAKTQST